MRKTGLMERAEPLNDLRRDPRSLFVGTGNVRTVFDDLPKCPVERHGKLPAAECLPKSAGNMELLRVDQSAFVWTEPKRWNVGFPAGPWKDPVNVGIQQPVGIDLAADRQNAVFIRKCRIRKTGPLKILSDQIGASLQLFRIFHPEFLPIPSNFVSGFVF